MNLLIPITSNAIIIYLIYFLGKVKTGNPKKFKMTFDKLLLFSWLFFLTAGIIGSSEFIQAEYSKVYNDYQLQMFIVWSIFVVNSWLLMIRWWIRLYL